MVDSRNMAERLADLRRDAALSWQDPAHLRSLDATMVGELRYQGERKGRDTGADGIDTAVGVQLDPRVGEPAAGRDHLPDHPSHRNGLEGEYALANEIARQFPDHTVIDFGRKAGERGADVISVDRDGMVTLWDSK